MSIRLPLDNIGTWAGHQAELARLIQVNADATAEIFATLSDVPIF